MPKNQEDMRDKHFKLDSLIFSYQLKNNSRQLKQAFYPAPIPESNPEWKYWHSESQYQSIPPFHPAQP